MAKNSYEDWDATAGNNLDVAGINIAEGCAAANINNALRAIMGQLAAYEIVGPDSTQTLTNKTLTAPVINGGTIDDAAIGGTTPDTGAFTTLTASTLTASTSVTVSGPATGITIEDDHVRWGSGDFIWWQSAEGLLGYENGILRWRLGSGALTYMRAVYENTSASSANVYINGSGNMLRSTSSGEYKINRAPVDSDVIAKLNPVSFTSTHEYDNGARLAGFIAEEVSEAFPEASTDNGKNYDVRAIVAALVAKVQEIETRLLRLEAGV